MNKANPIFNRETHYQIELQGRVDVEWLQSFDNSAKIIANDIRQMENIIVLSMYTDQAGIVGLVRRLHGLGITILQVKVVKDGKQF